MEPQTLFINYISLKHSNNVETYLYDLGKFGTRKIMKHSKNKDLIEWFYDNKVKEFHDLNQGHLITDKFMNKFTFLLRFFLYIRKEKSKFHCFVSSLSIYMKESLEVDNPKTMDEAISKSQICYQQIRRKVG